MLYKKIKPDKSPINSQLYKMEELKGWIADGGRVGWLVSDGYIVIDVDDMESSNRVQQMLDYTKVSYKCHSTPKGKHFIFKIGKYKGTQSSRFHTPVGIRVDTRLPNKGYIVLPINDPKRSVLLNTPFKDLDEAPFWLLPLKISTTNDDYITVGMGNDSGRNDALQRQIGRLKSAGLTPEQIKVAVILINEFVFNEPIAMTELEATVLREENLKVDNSESKSLSHNQIAEMLMEMYDIRYIKENFYIYDDGYYQNGSIQLRLMMRQICPTIKEQTIKEVFSYISDYTISSDNDIPDYFINLRNGNYSLKDGKMYPHSPDIAGRNRIEFEYTLAKPSAAVDKFLLDIANGNEERAKLILQMIGYSMTRTTREQVMFFLYGPLAKNGKSTLIDVMTALIGKSNRSVMSLQQIAKEKFMTNKLDNKVVNLCADISNKFLDDLAILKQLSSGDEIEVDSKFKSSFDMKPFAKFIFSANELPKASKDKGWERRLLIIPFERRFSAKDKDFNKDALLTPDALNYLGTKAIQAYQEIYNMPPALEGKWADAKSSEACLDVYKEEIDNAYSFYKTLDFAKMNCTVVNGERLYLKTELFNEYKDYVNENGLKEKSKISFGKTIKEHLKDRVYNNKHYWIIDGGI